MQNILVTGGAGFIGSNFVHFLLGVDPGARVITLDALTYAGSRENLRHLPDPDRHQFIHCDIRDQERLEAILRKESVDTIIHFAAESHVDRSIQMPAPFIETNIVGTFSLLEAIHQFWKEGVTDLSRARFIHVSTDEVYGSLAPDDPAFIETNRYQPNSPYAASKAAGDHLARAYQHTYGLPVVIANCSNNYGPRQFPEKLIPLMILKALEGRQLPIYGDGGQIRDWVYVDDTCRALLSVLRKGQVGETYHIGGDNQPTNLHLARQLCAILDDKIPDSVFVPHEQLITFVEDRPGHDRRYGMDIGKIRHELGWKPEESLESGLRKTINWYLEHPEWLEEIRQKPSYQKWIQRNYGARKLSS